MNSMSGQKLKGRPYTGTLPAVITGTKAGYLHKYKVYGDMTQSGTPTPSDPIYPSECGERTVNLFDSDTVYSAYKQADGTYQGTVNNFYTLHPTPFTASDIGKTFTFSIKVNATTSGNVRASANVGGVSINGNNLSAPGTTKVTFTVASTNDYLHLGYGSGGGNQINISDIMLTEGSTAPTSYIPYGYKLPLLSGSTPVDIYLGASQTTRQIGKIDLSELPWAVIASPGLWRTTSIPNIKYTSVNTELGDGIAEKYVMHIGSGMSTALNCIAIDTAQVSVNTGSNSIKPTGMFYYALATPETAVVNEPLRKIGDYADTIDSTQTSAQIPTSANSTTISWAGQGLEPSEFDSIQEWVDIPTYKRVSGEWVTDN